MPPKTKGVRNPQDKKKKKNLGKRHVKHNHTSSGISIIGQGWKAEILFSYYYYFRS